MADRRPLVIAGGQVRELPTADTIPQAAVNGLTASLAGKEPTISAATGTATDQYWRGNKTWRDFATDVRGAVLSGLSSASAAVITTSDTVIGAFGKLQQQITQNLNSLSAGLSARVLKAGDTMTGALVIDSSSTTAAKFQITPTGAGSHAAIDLTPKGTGNVAAITSYKQGTGTATPRWQLQINDGTTESGANSGSGFLLYGYTDAGSAQRVLYATRSSMAPATDFHYEAQGTGPTGYAYRTTSYDTGAGPVYVSYVLFTSPNYDLGMQGVHVSGNWAGWRMGIGGSTIDFRNNGHIYSSNGWSSASDARVKRDIKPVPNAWERFKAIKWFSYIRTDQPGSMAGPTQPESELGVIGQRLEKLEPTMTSRDWVSEDMPDHLSVKYPQVYNLGMATLNEAMERIEALEARIAQLDKNQAA